MNESMSIENGDFPMPCDRFQGCTLQQTKHGKLQKEMNRTWEPIIFRVGYRWFSGV